MLLARYPPVVAGEHLLAKITGGRTHTVPTDSVDTLGRRAEVLEREH